MLIFRTEFEAALVEMMIRHRNRQSNDEPDGEYCLICQYLLILPIMCSLEEEILDIVHESLRKKVASLDDDNWMFEPERDTFSN